MFLPEHEIWKFAYAGDELDDWLPHAEWLIQKWLAQTCCEVKFENYFQVILAGLLLKDNLLPASARVAFAELLIRKVTEQPLLAGW